MESTAQRLVHQRTVREDVQPRVGRVYLDTCEPLVPEGDDRRQGGLDCSRCTVGGHK